MKIKNRAQIIVELRKRLHTISNQEPTPATAGEGRKLVVMLNALQKNNPNAAALLKVMPYVEINHNGELLLNEKQRPANVAGLDGKFGKRIKKGFRKLGRKLVSKLSLKDVKNFVMKLPLAERLSFVKSLGLSGTEDIDTLSGNFMDVFQQATAAVSSIVNSVPARSSKPAPKPATAAGGKVSSFFQNISSKVKNQVKGFNPTVTVKHEVDATSNINSLKKDWWKWLAGAAGLTAIAVGGYKIATR